MVRGCRNQRTGITSLPIETLVHTFAHLPPRTIIACALVCKDWCVPFFLRVTLLEEGERR